MRRYFGLREIILFTILAGLAIGLYILSEIIFILVLFFIAIGLLFLTLFMFVWTALSGYKVDVLRKNIAKIILTFGEGALKAESVDTSGVTVRTEEFAYARLEKIAVRMNRIYIYAAVSVFFYVLASDVGAQSLADLETFLRGKLPEDKFKFKKTVRRYPKKPKAGA